MIIGSMKLHLMNEGKYASHHVRMYESNWGPYFHIGFQYVGYKSP